MFIKAVMSLATTDKDYRKTLKKRICMYYIMILLGVITFTLSIIFSTGSFAYLSDFLSGVYTGTGSALIAIGIVFIIKTKKILKDEGKIKQKRLAEQDERNQMITQRAMYTSSVILIFLAYISLMISGIFNLAVFWTLWVIIAVYMVIFISLLIYFNKKL